MDIILLYIGGRGRRTDDCISGFVSVDRMEVVLGNQVTRLFTADNGGGIQAIIPGNNFTCDGSILSWTFGAEWGGSSSRPVFTELQLWRKNGSDLYTKVGSTTLMAESENSSRIYHFPLASPLAFQTGDILGYFQGPTNVRRLPLLHEQPGAIMHFSIQDSSASQLDISELQINNVNVFVNVNTGKHYITVIYNYTLDLTA